MIQTLTPRQIALLAGAGSTALLAIAFVFQSLGYAPCELCVLQRWPHLFAAIIAIVIWFAGWRRWMGYLAFATMAVAVVLAAYHMGVEYDWWDGPAHCSGDVSNLAGLSTQDLMSQLQSAPVVRCDEVQWVFLGLSMAGWNMVCSIVLALIWVLAIRGNVRGGRQRIAF